MDHKILSIFEKDNFADVTTGLKLAQCMKDNIDESDDDLQETTKCIDELSVSEKLFCSFCNEAFEDKAQQRLHYKLDWHRYNLKRHLMGRSIVSEEEFQNVADDVSSISGSETDSEDEENSCDASVSKEITGETREQTTSDVIHKLQVEQNSKIFFENADGKILSVYRCLLHEKKNAPEKDSELVSSLLHVINKPNWAIIMLGGGHFAAAVYIGKQPIVHKTFHSYTVRARQGGTQSSRDGRSGGSHPKSAGASLRRYNEASFNQHVQDILLEWSKHIEMCSLILCRAVGHNRNLLFGGRCPLLSKNDLRVRSISFPTRRATFKEVQRIHNMMSTIEVYGAANMFKTSFPQSPRKSSSERKSKLNQNNPVSNVRNESNAIKEQEEIGRSRQPKQVDRAKARPSPHRVLPEIVTSILEEASPPVSDEGETTFVGIDQEISFGTDLQEYEDTVPQRIKDKMRRKLRKPKVKKTPNCSTQEKNKVNEDVGILQEKLVAACKLSNTVLLQECLKNALEATNSQETNDQSNCCQITQEEILNCLNEHVTKNGSTLLHIAAENGNISIIRTLLEAGCDPSSKNNRAQPPFAVAADRETRNCFRRFMGDYPGRYDYKKAQIPGPLNDDMEQRILERRKEVKKAKRDREKDKRKEETDMERFLKLSDREKRALAAERRILANNAQGKSDIRVVSRCFECAADITGKVPFEYDIHRFCTMDCLKKHRQKLKLVSSNLSN